MTLCIAAICRHHGEPRLVVATDTKVSTPMASSETQIKIDAFPRIPFAAVFSGEISEARKLLARYHDISIKPDCTVAQLEAHLLEPVHLLKEQMIEALVKRRVGMTYREFLERSTQFDIDRRTKIFNAIDEVSIGTELLIFGFFGRQPILFKEAWEDIGRCDAFACIGPGSQAAEQVLHRREQGIVEPLITTIYNVYEAKRLGEGAPTVGRVTNIMIFELPRADGSWLAEMKVISPTGLKFLTKCYAKFGPRPVKGLRMPDEEASFFWSQGRMKIERLIMDDED